MSFYNPIIIINEEAHNVIYFPLNRSRPHNINELLNDPSIAWTVAGKTINAAHIKSGSIN